MTTLIVNPSAGAGRCAARALELRPRLEAAFGALDWRESRSPEDVTRLAREAALRGDERVLVAGGDGTAHFAACGLVGTRTALGILPVGTGNDIAIAAGVPEEPLAAVAALGAGNVRAIDVGSVRFERRVVDAANFDRERPCAAGWSGERVYGCVLGVGMDTDALTRINAARWLKRGHLLYSLCAVRTLLTYVPRRMTIDYGSGKFEGEVVFAAVTNTRSYAGGMQISPLARVDDGELDVCIIPKMNKARLLASFSRVKSGRHVGMPGVVLARATRVTIECEERVPVTLDGELTDIRTPIEVRVLPRALRVLGVAPLVRDDAPAREAVAA